jgi:hypothetical protein
MPFAFLLAMQASGMIVDFFGSLNEQDMMDRAQALQEQNIRRNIEQIKLASENESLSSMKDLRQILGSQIAVMAARGTANAGSAIGIFNESVSNFNADERTRRMNLMAKEEQLRQGIAISRLQNSTEVSRLWQGFASRTLNRFPSSLSGWQEGIKQTKSAFGLTSIE